MDEQHVTYIVQVVENALMVMVDTSANTIYVEEDQIQVSTTTSYFLPSIILQLTVTSRFLTMLFPKFTKNELFEFRKK